MSRNVQLNILRGLLANMPTLNNGELYLCTDTLEVYVGQSAANNRVGVSANVKPGTGAVSAQALSSVPGGPASPKKPIAFTSINIKGTTYWIPLYQ